MVTTATNGTATPSVPHGIPYQHHSTSQASASTPLGFPHSILSQWPSMHLQQDYTLNQSTTSTTFTFSSMLSSTTHGFQ